MAPGARSFLVGALAAVVAAEDGKGWSRAALLGCCGRGFIQHGFSKRAVQDQMEPLGQMCTGARAPTTRV